MSKKKRTIEEKLKAINLYLNGQKNQTQLGEMYKVNPSTIVQWVRNYESMGLDAFDSHFRYYSKELKLQAVEDYINGCGSLNDLCKKYKIRSKDKLHQWVVRYNSHKQLPSSITGGSTIMTKGRTTTYDERLAIVQYCISHNHNYAKAAIEYQISYQQARSYTLKYEKGGVDALKDNRGRLKSKNEMDEMERLRAEIKVLKAQKKQAEMEVAFLKKLKEIEGRRD